MPQFSMDGLLLGQHVRHGSHSYPNNYYVYENTLSWLRPVVD